MSWRPFALDFAERESAPARFDGEPEKALLPDFDVPFVIAPTAADHREADSGVRLELDEHGAVIQGWGVPRVGARQADRFWGALHVAFHEALRASGLLPFHAAVVTCGGRAVALAGPSGAGKSTTLLRAIRGGDWAILAEDLSWLDPDTLVLHGWDSGLRLWADSLEQFASDLAPAQRWSTDARGKRFLPWHAFDAPLHRAARLDTVLLLSRGEASVADRPVQAPEALKILWETTGTPLLPSGRKRVALVLGTLLHRIRFGRHMLGQPLTPPG